MCVQDIQTAEHTFKTPGFLLGFFLTCRFFFSIEMDPGLRTLRDVSAGAHGTAERPQAMLWAASSLRACPAPPLLEELVFV